MNNSLKTFEVPFKHRVGDFLRLRGVRYKDLVTGDHAADLLVSWAEIMTDYLHRLEIQQLQFDILNYAITPTYKIFYDLNHERLKDILEEDVENICQNSKESIKIREAFELGKKWPHDKSV